MGTATLCKEAEKLTTKIGKQEKFSDEERDQLYKLHDVIDDKVAACEGDDDDMDWSDDDDEEYEDDEEGEGEDEDDEEEAN